MMIVDPRAWLIRRGTYRPATPDDDDLEVVAGLATGIRVTPTFVAMTWRSAWLSSLTRRQKRWPEGSPNR